MPSLMKSTATTSARARSTPRSRRASPAPRTANAKREATIATPRIQPTAKDAALGSACVLLRMRTNARDRDWAHPDADGIDDRILHGRS
jgi:hypothetical protein